jgi:hypothetical protein
MNSRYLFNIKFRLPDDVEASFSVTGDDQDGVIADARAAFAKLTQERSANAQASTNGNGKAPSKAKAPVPSHSDPHTCPDHQTAREGRWGLYCPVQIGEDEDGNPIYCQWKPAKITVAS